MDRRRIPFIFLAAAMLLLLTACAQPVDAGKPLSENAAPETAETESDGAADLEADAVDTDIETNGKIADTIDTETTPDAANTEPGVETDTGVTTPPEVVTITINAAGDASLGNYVGQGYSWSFNETYSQKNDNSYFFENVYDIFSQDDMTIVNLEGVLTLSEDLRPNRMFNIKGDPGYADILTCGSVEAVSMANNHRLDFKEAGTEDTLEALKPTGIVYAYDENVGIYETKGIRIGIASINEVDLSGEEVEQIMKEDIEKLKAENVDLIFSCCHWGIELDHYPNEFQRKLGRECIEWGADLVIGHHPHVLQGVEKYQGKYIIYSLGNFCFGANRDPKDKDTMIIQETFTFVDGEKQIKPEFRMIPCYISSVSYRNDYKPTPAEGEEALRIINRVNKYSDDFNVRFDENGYVTER